jgi:hypothetical protein
MGACVRTSRLSCGLARFLVPYDDLTGETVVAELGKALIAVGEPAVVMPAPMAGSCSSNHGDYVAKIVAVAPGPPGKLTTPAAAARAYGHADGLGHDLDRQPIPRRPRQAQAEPSRGSSPARRIGEDYRNWARRGVHTSRTGRPPRGPPSLVTPKADPLGDDGSAARSGGCPRPQAPWGVIREIEGVPPGGRPSAA